MTIKRTEMMIKGDFQQRLIMNTLLITLITLNAIILIAAQLDDHFGSKGSLLNVFNLSVAIMELITVVIVYFISRRLSFHIAGPIYAVERTLRAMRDGDLVQRLKLRPKDEFQEVADAINGVLESYHSRLDRVKDLAAIENPTPEQRQQLLAELGRFVTKQ